MPKKKVSDVAYWKTCCTPGCERRFTVPSWLQGKLYSYCMLCSDKRKGEIEGQRAA